MDRVTQEKIKHSSDLDLAILVSLISSQHCIVSTERSATSELRDELRLTCSERFRLQTAVINCSKDTTADEFSEALLVDVLDEFNDAPERLQSPQHGVHVDFSPLRNTSYGRPDSIGNELDERKIADVVIATHLDLADPNVQVQALELLRTRRIFTRTSMHVAPKDFLLVVVLSRPGARLGHHLNDMFAMSHDHAEEDGLPHLEEGTMEKSVMPMFSPDDIKSLRGLVDSVKLSGEVRQYLHNVVVFMRMSRYVEGGVTAASTRHLRALATALAPLHGMDFVTPSLVALGARKVYPHRLILATAEAEKSLQWGSDPDTVREMLEGETVDDVIEDVLGSFEAPL